MMVWPVTGPANILSTADRVEATDDSGLNMDDSVTRCEDNVLA